ncbi:MAG: hypothetical protein K2G88_05085 [Oscillospiraceae bacterium]|nr:hypothetical protein [Oscillospiraceae bacterium]
MKKLCKAISILTAFIFVIWVIFKLANRIHSKLRKNYITIDSEYIHV